MDESSEDDGDADEVMNSEDEDFEDEEETAEDNWRRMFYEQQDMETSDESDGEWELVSNKTSSPPTKINIYFSNHKILHNFSSSDFRF